MAQRWWNVSINISWLWDFIRKYGRYSLLIVSAYFGVMVGNAAHRLIQDSLVNGGFIMTENGNNLLVFTPSLKPKDPFYDNGKAITIWLRLRHDEIQHPYFYADLIRFYYEMYNAGSPNPQTAAHEPFHFQSFPLSVRNAENLIIEVIPEE